MDSEELAPLPPGEPLQDSLTLLRGGDGALFPMAGVHLIEVTAQWETGGQIFRLTGQTQVIVTSPADDAHAIAALRILSNPDTLPVLVVGGDHLTKGISAIQTALANPVLRPHYAFIEAKRLAAPFFQRPADPSAAARLIDRTAVLNEAEIRKAATFTPTLEPTLQYLVKKYDCSSYTRRAVDRSGK